MEEQKPLKPVHRYEPGNGCDCDECVKAQVIASWRADIRTGSIDPVYSETLYITGFNEWGPEE